MAWVCAPSTWMLPMALAVAASSPAAGPAEPIQPVPLTHNQVPDRVELGRMLFHDARLSGNGKVSCASCHDLRKAGSDGLPRSPGLNGKLTGVNTPTVLNAALNFRQFWNGRAASLEAQIDEVIRNPDEMGSSWEGVVKAVSSDAAYRTRFATAYGGVISKENIQDAIASFERTLITPNSRFDRYLRGDPNAISPAEKAGYAAFKQYGCIACHQGVNIGGNMFQRFGVMGDYSARRGKPTPDDLGRYLVTQAERDRHVFKVPGLRNVAVTAPYLHDGSAKTLEEAVDVMFRHQLKRVASAEDKKSIVLFLGTLTGEIAGPP